MKISDSQISFKKMVLFAALSLPVLGASCTDETSPYVENLDNQVEITAVADTNDLETNDENAISLFGQYKSQVSGPIFLMEGGENEGLENVLVVNRSDRSFFVPTNEDTPLWVFGEVRPLDSSDVAGVEIDEIAPYEAAPAVFARRITLVPEPTDLTENPVAFYNQDVTVYGQVDQVGFDRVFILEDPELFDGKGVVVLQMEDVAEQPIPEDARIAVSGILRPFIIADLEQEYDLTLDSDIVRELETEYYEIPVLVSDRITLTND